MPTKVDFGRSVKGSELTGVVYDSMQKLPEYLVDRRSVDGGIRLLAVADVNFDWLSTSVFQGIRGKSQISAYDKKRFATVISPDAPYDSLNFSVGRLDSRTVRPYRPGEKDREDFDKLVSLILGSLEK